MDDSRFTGRGKERPPPIPLYPIDFMNKHLWSYRGRACEELLRPQLEEGVIGAHDYNLTVQFSRIEAKRYAVASAASGIAMGGMSWWLARLGNHHLYVSKGRPIPYIMTSLARTVPVFLGFLAGSAIWTGSRMKDHVSFCNEIEDPMAFSRSIDNVRKSFNFSYFPGSSGQTPTLWALRAGSYVLIQGLREENDQLTPVTKAIVLKSATNQPTLAESGGGVFPSSDQGQQEPPRLSPFSRSDNENGKRSPSRWDAIRSQEGTATQSSWDAIRQSNEQPHSPQTTPGSRPTFSGSFIEWEDKADAQAKFDEMLEAERRKSK